MRFVGQGIEYGAAQQHRPTTIARVGQSCRSAFGGAMYEDRCYNRVFIGHNGAESYYSGRGFRGSIRV
jgi:hypothetical protein